MSWANFVAHHVYRHASIITMTRTAISLNQTRSKVNNPGSYPMERAVRLVANDGGANAAAYYDMSLASTLKRWRST